MTASLSTEEKRNNVNQAVFTDTSDQVENLKVASKETPKCTMTPPSQSSAHLDQSSLSNTQTPSACKTFTVPKTSGQFQADWRALQKEPEQLFHYFRVSSLHRVPYTVHVSLNAGQFILNCLLPSLLKIVVGERGVSVFFVRTSLPSMHTIKTDNSQYGSHAWLIRCIYCLV